MKVIRNETHLYCDVDDTLIIWGYSDRLDMKDVVNIPNPYDNSPNWVKPHKGHIKILKDRWHRGSHVTVWSAGGWEWALTVVKALGLESYVHVVASKPLAYMDDKKADEFMGEHIYLGKLSTYGE